MTLSERNAKLKLYITCLKCEVSGKCCDDNCPTQYDAGNMGEIIENLEAISEALEGEPSRDREEIQEVLDCDADAEIKCKMISDILNAKPHYFKITQDREIVGKNRGL